MSFEPTDDLQKTFRTMQAEVDVEYWQKEARSLTRLADWEKLQEINNRFTREIKTQARKYHRDHARRVDMACKHIAHLRGEDFDKLKRRTDPRSKQLTKAILKAAGVDVETDHHRRTVVLREHQAKELRELIETARARDAGPGAPKLLTDGRKGPDRWVRGR